jgi:uncharacterized repeat protein (TIGR02543 family)
LVIYLDQPFNFTDLVPDISLNDTAGSYSPSSLVVTKPATVTATQPAAGTSLPITFKVTSATSETSFTLPVGPESIASFDSTTKTFSWDIGGSPPVAVGSYLAVFEGTSGANKSQLVVMINITAPGYTLTVNTVGSGTVTKNPDQATYTTSPVQNVQLTPNPGSGYSFSGWSGDLSGSANPANIVMNDNKTVTATFAQTPATLYTLTVNVSPSSGGTVALSPSGGSYSAGTQVTLTATANANYTFGSWSGVDSSSGTTAYVTMGSANRSVTATFTQQITTTACQTGDLTSSMSWSQRSTGTWYFCIPENTKGISVQAIGSTDSTDATLTWTFPDGREFKGLLKGQGTMSVGLRIWSQHSPSPSISDNYIPAGRHTLAITGSFSGFMSAGF